MGLRFGRFDLLGRLDLAATLSKNPEGYPYYNMGAYENRLDPLDSRISLESGPQ